VVLDAGQVGLLISVMYTCLVFTILL